MKYQFTIILACICSINAFSGWVDAVQDGGLILNLRLRIESVDQKGKEKDAFATTLRTRLGYQTGAFRGWTALLEFENTTVLGDTRYNDTVNGDLRFPVVADPEDTEVNRMSLQYTGLAKQKWILGRQRIIFDNARFIGNVGWRQNEQTFDGLLWNYTGIKHTKLVVAYLDNANRIFGDSHPTNSDFRQESFLINGKIEVGRAGNIALFGYFLDFKNNPNASHRNVGIRFDGKHKLNGPWSWSHDLSYVDQADYQDGDPRIGSGYHFLGLGIHHGPWALKANLEVLEGNRSFGFRTPLATLHAYNGWADVFLATPATGLEDRFLELSYKKNGWNCRLIAHQFDEERGSLDYGSEIDGLIAKKIGSRTTIGLKFADYSAKDFGIDTTKVWGFGQFVW